MPSPSQASNPERNPSKRLPVTTYQLTKTRRNTENSRLCSSTAEISSYVANRKLNQMALRCGFEGNEKAWVNVNISSATCLKTLFIGKKKYR